MINTTIVPRNMSIAEFRTKRAQQTQNQNLLNEIYGNLSTSPDYAAEYTRKTMLSLLAFQYWQFPQYEGHWDDWEIVCVHREFSGKSGLAFSAGDVTLGKRENVFGRVRWVLYSFRVAVDYSIGIIGETCNNADVSLLG